MADCSYDNPRYHCPYEADNKTGDGFCIFHSPSPVKDPNAFKSLLACHRKHCGDLFIGFQFPNAFSFKGETFVQDADFSNANFETPDMFVKAKFEKPANFSKATFAGPVTLFQDTEFSDAVSFQDAEFTGHADFSSAIFSGRSGFRYVKFKESAVFGGAVFEDETDFSYARFTSADFTEADFHTITDFSAAEFEKFARFVAVGFIEDVYFSRTEFREGVSFLRAEFTGNAHFGGAKFCGITNLSRVMFSKRGSFLSAREEGKICQMFEFAQNEGYLDFTNVLIEPSGSLFFSDSDLRKARFLGTDVRKIEFVGETWPVITWPEISWLPNLLRTKREAVYDEIVSKEHPGAATYPHMAQLYRRLKHNYEDEKNYARAGDFHYGEKQMRRWGENRASLRILLTLYWAVSGYGERFLLPLLWTILLFLTSTTAYLHWNLLKIHGTSTIVDWSGFSEAFLYSLRVMTLLKPTNFEPVGLPGDAIYTLQSILGPILIGLSALAIRQQLKR